MNKFCNVQLMLCNEMMTQIVMLYHMNASNWIVIVPYFIWGCGSGFVVPELSIL